MTLMAEAIKRRTDSRAAVLLAMTHLAQAAIWDEDAQEQLKATLHELTGGEEDEVSYLLDPNAQPDIEGMRKAGLLSRVPKTDQEVQPQHERKPTDPFPS
jgi:hypothetical protein